VFGGSRSGRRGPPGRLRGSGGRRRGKQRITEKEERPEKAT
jgi:hypothetical protein